MNSNENRKKKKKKNILRMCMPAELCLHQSPSISKLILRAPLVYAVLAA